MSTAVITRPVIKKGSKGPEVAKIQKALQNAGFSPGRIDSDFGLKTDQAVRYFQIDHHLKVDGIVGKDTWALLQKYSTPNKVHVIKQGDSLWDISQKYHVSVDEIKKVNPGIDEMNLPVGKELKIPNTGGPANTPSQVQTYEVKKDDTLYKLHQRFNVSVDEIKKANPGINEYNLPVGKIINIPKPNTGGGGRPTPPPGLSPSGDNFNKVWKFFKDLKFSDEATAGIMGNLQQESQMDPKSKQYNGGPGRGLAQWETKKIRGGSGRWETLEKFADRHNLDKWDLYTQLKFIWWELTEEPWIKSQVKKYAGSLEQFMKIKNIDDAIIKWERLYEQAGNPVLGDRKKFAYAIYTRFARV